MQTQVTKRLDFSGKKISVGLDVHKKSWSVTILVEGMEHKTYTQPPNPQVLSDYLNRMFPNGEYQSAYEAGFCGYSIHRELLKSGINNHVINPSDIPRNQKEMLSKTERIDSRKIARSLDQGTIQSIFVFDQNLEELRSLSRARINLMKDLRRSKNRIKSFLLYYGIEVPPEFDNNHWSLKFQKWIEKIEMHSGEGKETIHQLLTTYRHFRQQMLDINNQLRKYIRQYDRELYELLRTIPGIGPLTAIVLITELGNINRFRHLNQLSSYVGLIPRIKQSGESERVGDLTFRCNRYLRTMLVESAWQAIRLDPVLMQYYQQKLVNSKGQKVIIKVARKLLNRIRYVMKNRKPYIMGVIE
jgi:transposase